jgi:AraC-like DNA-binding protein
LKFDAMPQNGVLPWQIIRKGSGLLPECCAASLASLQRLKLRYETEAPLLCALLKVLLLSLYKENFQQEENPLLKKLQHLIDELPYPKISARALAKKCNYSADHLSVLVKTATGLSLKAYINRHIQKKAEALLANSGCTIGEIADRLGFTDQYSFSHFFHNNTGISPSSYRKSLGKTYFSESFF